MAKILLVEDQASMRSLFSQLLQAKGHTVVLAEDGEEAWDICTTEKENFDLVLTDVNMPRLDGYEFLKRTRQHFPGVKVILITGANEEAAAVICQEYKADGLITKPFVVEEAISLIEKVLQP
ncbi:MAG: response regulator [Candidatus Margulisbacteria bacterium]|nr:response regulator [Candidatus Margulisiibacteriota bacterium]